MKKYIIIFLVLLVNSVFAQWHLENGNGEIISWVKIDTCFFTHNYYNDFADMAFLITGSGYNFDSGMNVGYQLQYLEDGKWATIADALLSAFSGSSNGYIVVYDNMKNVGHIGSLKGNGDFRVRAFAKIWNPVRTDTSVWSYTTVNDIVAPATPESLQGDWYNGHPKLTFYDNSESDKKGYFIYKRVNNGSSKVISFITDTIFVDNSETQYSLGNDKKMVYYKVSCEDNTKNESLPTPEIRFVCNNQISKPNIQNNNSPVNEFVLYQNYPNPFNPTTIISFTLKKKEEIKLEVFNVVGEKVAAIFNGVLNSGTHSFDFNAENLPSGTYIYRISVDKYSASKKMNLIK